MMECQNYLGGGGGGVDGKERYTLGGISKRSHEKIGDFEQSRLLGTIKF